WCSSARASSASRCTSRAGDMRPRSRTTGTDLLVGAHHHTVMGATSPTPDAPSRLVSDRAASASQRTAQHAPLMKNLQHKVAIVTGASKGIGASIARHLADEGAAVVVNYASSRAEADRVVAEITRNGGRAIAVQANVAKQADVDRLFAETTKAFGRLDILVNNAGVYAFVPLEDVTEEHFHKQFDTNVLSVLLASKAAARYFRDAGGSIVNISS